MKDLVLRQLLTFVSEYVPLSEAWCATLGGHGVEARLWQEVGVRPERGVLIERSTKLSRPLIAHLPYEYYPRLESFAPWWERNRSGVGLDLLHLDLCGTLEPLLETARTFFPLVARSRGQCLAITVTEKRRNRSLESYELVRARMTNILDPGALDRVEKSLLREHESLGRILDVAPTANPEKGMKREVGFLWCLLHLLIGPNGDATLPDRIERYAYHSDYGRRTGRMRTTFLHFSEPVSALNAAQTLAERWLGSSLFVGHDREITPVPPSGVPPRPKRTRGRPRGSGRRKEPEALRNGSDPTVMVQLALLRAEAEGSEALQAAWGTVASALGLRGRTPRTRRIIAALRAQMFGRFRSAFVRSAVAYCGEHILPELAALYSRLKSEPVAAEELRAEAGNFVPS